MTDPNNALSSTEAAGIIFGTARGAARPQAGWFRAGDKELAVTVALKLGLSVFDVDTDSARAAVSELREVQVRQGEDPVIPVVDAALLRRLAVVQRDVTKQEASRGVPILGGSSDAPRPPRKLALWNALKVGELVLAADLDRKGVPDGWFEAVITALDGDVFLVRFRDYPGEGTAKRRRHHIALLYT